MAGVKSLARRALRGLGLEVLRTKHANIEPQVLKNVLRATGAAAILDVGANAGQYGDLVFEVGFAGSLVSFEAMPDVHRELVNHARRRPSWVVAPCAAIGRQKGTIEFNVAGNSVSSSVLPMKHAHLDVAPESRYVSTVSVDMARLDEIAMPLVPPDATLLIKVDTQGYELEVLKGATALLPRTVALQLELSLVPLYEGAPTLTEMIAFAERIGFDLFSLVPGFWDVRTGRLLQADGFFVRRDATDSASASY